MAKDWIGKAEAKMKSAGTVGKFGKATEKKIAAAKKKGGKAEKEAVFAENMKKIAETRTLLRAEGTRACGPGGAQCHAGDGRSWVDMGRTRRTRRTGGRAHSCA